MWEQMWAYKILDWSVDMGLDLRLEAQFAELC